jgi:hypothetical protein
LFIVHCQLSIANGDGVELGREVLQASLVFLERDCAQRILANRSFLEQPQRPTFRAHPGKLLFS